MSTSWLSASLPGSGRVLFTDRSSGNMSSVHGLYSERAQESRGRLREEIGVSGLARCNQVHGAAVRHVDEASASDTSQDQLPPVDGQLTTVPGLGMLALSADCLLVAIGRPGAVAMVHAGWRGLAAGILEKGVSALLESGSGAMTAVMGPGAGACCYEVGPEVHEALGEVSHGKAKIDLRAIAIRRLLSAGVRQVEDLGGCTICDRRFFSYRREGHAAGRMAGVAWLS